jgi:hypothetical protein
VQSVLIVPGLSPIAGLVVLICAALPFLAALFVPFGVPEAAIP